MKLHQPVV